MGCAATLRPRHGRPTRGRALAPGLDAAAARARGVLLLPLLAVSLEGVAHAALHLGHTRHADSLAIDAAAAVPAVELDARASEPSPVLIIGDLVESRDALVPQIVVAVSRGRAPPLLPA